MKMQLKLRKFKIANLNVPSKVIGGAQGNSNDTCHQCHSIDCTINTESIRREDCDTHTIGDTTDNPNCIRGSKIITNNNDNGYY